VAALSPELREAFALRFWNEFSYEQIGEIQGDAKTNEAQRAVRFTTRETATGSRLHHEAAAQADSGHRRRTGVFQEADEARASRVRRHFDDRRRTGARNLQKNFASAKLCHMLLIKAHLARRDRGRPAARRGVP
jgi:hypothetical protein